MTHASGLIPKAGNSHADHDLLLEMVGTLRFAYPTIFVRATACNGPAGPASAESGRGSRKTRCRPGLARRLLPQRHEFRPLPGGREATGARCRGVAERAERGLALPDLRP